MKRFALALATMALGAASAQAATLIDSWENSAEGWTASGVTFAYSNSTGVTDQSYALSFTAPTGWAWPVQIGNWNGTTFPALNNAQKTGSALEIDVTLSTLMTGTQWFNVSGWEWTATSNLAMAGQNLQNVLTPQTITIPLVAGKGGPDGAGVGLGPVDWTQFRLVTQPSGAGADPAYVPGTIYFDNFRVVAVPEPTTIGLLGLGSLALLRRRRRRA